MTQTRPSSPLRSAVVTALAEWGQDGVTRSPLQRLLLWQQAAQESTSTPHSTTNALLLQGIERLMVSAPQDAALLRRRFLDNELAHKLANEANWAESTFYRKQNEAIDQLTDLFEGWEQAAWLEHSATLASRLEPPSYVQLIGVDAHLTHLAALLVQPGPPWLLAIEALGGMGKTALADALARQLLAQRAIHALGWVTARQSVFNLGGSITPLALPVLTAGALVEALYNQLTPPAARPAAVGYEEMVRALTRRLKAQPHVIFIDNLETVLDVEKLLPTLRQLANPTRFVLTTRHSRFGEPDIYHFALPELSQHHAQLFIRQEARLRNLPQVAAASDSDLQPIIATVGGNPLALRLVVGQLHIHALDTILADLTQGQTAKVENFYTFIYGRAWAYLSELERQALLALPMTHEEGGTLAYLAAVSRLGQDALSTALDRLVALNLVDCRRVGLSETRYTIHNLTRTFLHRQIAHWPEAEKPGREQSA